MRKTPTHTNSQFCPKRNTGKRPRPLPRPWPSIQVPPQPAGFETPSPVVPATVRGVMQQPAAPKKQRRTRSPLSRSAKPRELPVTQSCGLDQRTSPLLALADFASGNDDPANVPMSLCSGSLDPASSSQHLQHHKGMHLLDQASDLSSCESGLVSSSSSDWEQDDDDDADSLEGLQEMSQAVMALAHISEHSLVVTIALPEDVPMSQRDRESVNLDHIRRWLLSARLCRHLDARNPRLGNTASRWKSVIMLRSLPKAQDIARTGFQVEDSLFLQECLPSFARATRLHGNLLYRIHLIEEQLGPLYACLASLRSRLLAGRAAAFTPEEIESCRFPNTKHSLREWIVWLFLPYHSTLCADTHHAIVSDDDDDDDDGYEYDIDLRDPDSESLVLPASVIRRQNTGGLGNSQMRILWQVLAEPPFAAPQQPISATATRYPGGHNGDHDQQVCVETCAELCPVWYVALARLGVKTGIPCLQQHPEWCDKACYRRILVPDRTRLRRFSEVTRFDASDVGEWDQPISSTVFLGLMEDLNLCIHGKLRGLYETLQVNAEEVCILIHSGFRKEVMDAVLAARQDQV